MATGIAAPRRLCGEVTGMLINDRHIHPDMSDSEQVVFQKWRWPCLHRPSKGIAVDKQANDDVVHLGRF